MSSGGGKGLLRQNSAELRETLKESTRKSDGIAAESVGNTDSATGSERRHSASVLTKEDRVQAWERTIPIRYRTVMRQARSMLAKMPYPPQVR